MVTKKHIPAHRNSAPLPTPEVSEKHLYRYDGIAHDLAIDRNSGVVYNSGQLDVKVDNQWYAVIFDGARRGVYRSLLADEAGVEHRQININNRADVQLVPSPPRARHDAMGYGAILNAAQNFAHNEPLSGDSYLRAALCHATTHELSDAEWYAAVRQATDAVMQPAAGSAVAAAGSAQGELDLFHDRLRQALTPYFSVPPSDAEWQGIVDRAEADHGRAVERYALISQSFPQALVKLAPPLPEHKKHALSAGALAIETPVVYTPSAPPPNLASQADLPDASSGMNLPSPRIRR